MHASVVSVEADLAPHVRDRDSAIVCLDTQISGLRNENFVTDAPPGIVNGIWPYGAHLPTTAVDRDLARQQIRGGLRLGRRIDACANQNIAPQPTFDRRATVVALHAEASDVGQSLLTDIAMARAVPIVAAVVASHLYFGVVLHLSK